MLKKILLIDNPVHLRTKSNQFLIELFSQHEVSVVYDGSWLDLTMRTNFDLILFFQEFPDLKFLSFLNKKNVVFVPMWDACRRTRLDQWWELKEFRFVSFSRALDKKLSGLGFCFFSLQYFPCVEFEQQSEKKEDSVSIFFWQRTHDISLKTVLHILPKDVPVQIFYRSDVDLSLRFSGNVFLKQVPWFETKKELWDFLKKCDLYIAPRRYEGIGLSFLEAMALGLIVVASDTPTMNEYIEHEKTGFLLQKNRRLDLSKKKLDLMKSTLKSYALKSYQNYLDRTTNLFDYLFHPQSDGKKKENFLLDTLVNFKQKVRKFF